MSTIPQTLNTAILNSPLYQSSASNSKTLKNVDLFSMDILNKANYERDLKHSCEVTITINDDSDSTMEFLKEEKMLFSSAMRKVIKKLEELANDKKFKVSGELESSYSALFGCSIRHYNITIVFPDGS